MTIRALKALKVPKVPTNVQKNLRAKELKDKVGSGKPAQRKNDTKKVVGEAQRKARTADRGDKTQAVAKKVLPEVTKVRKKVEGMTIDQLSTNFTGKELKAMEMKLKQASKPNQALLNKLLKARDQRTGMVEASETPSDRPQKTPAKFRKKGGTVKRKGGGNLKPVDAKKNPGLAKLPTPVRNRMGFAKKGKQVSESMGEDRTSVPAEYSAKAQSKKKKKMGGGKVYKRKHSGKVIKNNMSGQDLVNACYD
tara:strand:+ start:227 stop:979 length:753 start_codon:yes stop_codon:yes gene_type:complete